MSREAKRLRLEKARVKRAAKARSQELADPKPVFDLNRFNELVDETMKERGKILENDK